MSNLTSYKIKDGCICLVVRNKDEESYVPLCNFVAIITKEIIRDDGTNKINSLIIEAEGKNGEIFSPIEIPSESFSSLQWVSKLGPKAIIYSGYMFRDHLRVAIQECSVGHETTTIYTSTGWININGINYYLTSSGAISSDGLNKDIIVDLESSQLQNYTLPPPPTTSDELINAIRASMSVIDEDIPDYISIPIFSSLYRAAIGDIKEINFTLMIVGSTGVLKTTYAGLLLGHFGKFDDLHVPESWLSTANSLERKAYLLKDAWFLVDDLILGESNPKVVDTLIRGQGNGVGRGRLKSDCTLRITNRPRSFLVTTAEDVPASGQSLKSRIMFIEIKKGEISTDAIDKIIQNQHQFSLAMSGFISWLAKKYTEKKISIPNRFKEVRKRFMGKGAHQRIPSMIADLLIGLEEFLEYAVDSGAISEEESVEIIESRAIPTYHYLLERQKLYTEISDPVDIFITNVRSALITGKAHLKAKGSRTPHNPERWGWKTDRDGNWVTSGEHIGWINGNEIWFQPEAVFNIANRLASSPSQKIHISREALWGRIADRGLLTISAGESKNTIKRQVDANRRPRVIVFHDQTLFQNDLGEMDETLAPCAPENMSNYESLVFKANAYANGTYISTQSIKTQ